MRSPLNGTHKRIATLVIAGALASGGGRTMTEASAATKTTTQMNATPGAAIAAVRYQIKDVEPRDQVLHRAPRLQARTEDRRRVRDGLSGPIAARPEWSWQLRRSAHAGRPAAGTGWVEPDHRLRPGYWMPNPGAEGRRRALPEHGRGRTGGQANPGRGPRRRSESSSTREAPAPREFGFLQCLPAGPGRRNGSWSSSMLSRCDPACGCSRSAAGRVWPRGSSAKRIGDGHVLAINRPALAMAQAHAATATLPLTASSSEQRVSRSSRSLPGSAPTTWRSRCASVRSTVATPSWKTQLWLQSRRR